MSNDTTISSENVELLNSGVENVQQQEEIPTQAAEEAIAAPIADEAVINEPESIPIDVSEPPEGEAQPVVAEDAAPEISPEPITPATEEPAAVVAAEQPAAETPAVPQETVAAVVDAAPEVAAEQPAVEVQTETPTQAVAEPTPVSDTVAAATEASAPESNEPDPKQQARDERNARLDSLFDQLKAAKETDSMVEVDVKSRIRGGLRVMYDELPIFLPASHFSLKRNPSEEELQEVVGKRIPVYIHEVQDDGGNRRTVIVSRKKILEGDFWDKLNIGDIVEGTVSSIATFGIFLDLGGIEGLIHISRLSQAHIDDTRTFAKKGQRMQAVVVEIDKVKKRIALSRKELEESPWSKVEERYPVGSQFKGIVRRLTEFGAYIELETGIDGLLRTAEISWMKRVKKPSDVLEINQELDVHILSISKEKQTMSLSHRRTLPNPWQDLQARYPIGSEYKGIVSQVMPQGAIVCLNDEIDGFMPRSKMKNLSRGKKIPFNVGEEVEVIIAELSPEQESLILSPKAEEMPPEPERQNNRRMQEPKPQTDQNRSPEGAFTLMDLLSDKDKSNLFNVSE